MMKKQNNYAIQWPAWFNIPTYVTEPNKPERISSSCDLFPPVLVVYLDCNGVYYVVKVVSKLLDSKTSEYTATYVGRLVSILISKMGSSLGDYLDLMLRAVLSKMQQAETHTVIQVT